MKKFFGVLIALTLSLSSLSQIVAFADTDNEAVDENAPVLISENVGETEGDVAEDATDSMEDEVQADASSEAVIPEFSDMPNNWTTQALINAVKNGLLNGADGKIMPDDNITRAQMAAIIVRAFGAKTEADISIFTDVAPENWFYSEFARAVEMKAFNGTDDNKLNPNNNITFQECFAVVSRVFGLPKADESCLEKFADGQDVAEWAIPEVSKVIAGGYWDGIDNKLTPNEYITRSEFAVLMDNFVKTYINEPGEYNDLPAGNVLIRTNDVVLNDIVSDGLIIIGDAVDKTNKIYINNVKSTGQIIVRGGEVYVSGEINGIRVINPGLFADISAVTERTGIMYIEKDSVINFGIADLTPSIQ